MKTELRCWEQSLFFEPLDRLGVEESLHEFEEAREIERNFPGMDLGIKKTRNSFQEEGSPF